MDDSTRYIKHYMFDLEEVPSVEEFQKIYDHWRQVLLND